MTSKINQIKQTARVEFQSTILNADGSINRVMPWRKNLILDQGLDNVSNAPWPAQLTHAKVGTGTNPFQRDSGSITFTQAAATVTASAGFFTSADVGRLLKMDSGEESYITAFTSSTIVTVADSRTVVAQQGTIWYVNRTALQTEVTDTSNYDTAGGANVTTFAGGDTFTHQRTFIFPAVLAPITYNEIGWSNVTGFIFGATVISGGDALTTGQQYKVVVRLIVTCSPATSAAFGDVGNNGFSTAGNGCFQNQNGFAAINAGSEPGACMDPSGGKFMQTVQGTVTLSNLATGAPVYTALGGGAMTVINYAAGSFQKDWFIIIPVTDSNSTDFRGFIILNNGGTTSVGFMQRFTAAQTKDSSHTLTLTFRLTWQRALVN